MKISQNYKGGSPRVKTLSIPDSMIHKKETIGGLLQKIQNNYKDNIISKEDLEYFNEGVNQIIEKETLKNTPNNISSFVVKTLFFLQAEYIYNKISSLYLDVLSKGINSIIENVIPNPPQKPKSKKDKIETKGYTEYSNNVRSEKVEVKSEKNIFKANLLTSFIEQEYFRGGISGDEIKIFIKYLKGLHNPTKHKTKDPIPGFFKFVYLDLKDTYNSGELLRSELIYFIKKLHNVLKIKLKTPIKNKQPKDKLNSNLKYDRYSSKKTV